MGPCLSCASELTCRWPGFEGGHLWKSVDVEKGARGRNLPATPQMESNGLYSIEVGKVQGKSPVSSQKQKSPELTPAPLRYGYHTPRCTQPQQAGHPGEPRVSRK